MLTSLSSAQSGLGSDLSLTRDSPFYRHLSFLLLPTWPPSCPVSQPDTPEEALNVAQAGREGARRPAGVARTHDTETLISLASKTLQLFPVPSPPEQHGNSQEESEQ